MVVYVYNPFVKHRLKPTAYLRYGDDFVLIEPNLENLELFRTQTISFLKDELKLEINPKCDKIIKFRYRLKYLGVKLWPSGRTLTRRNLSRVKQKLKTNNISSYSGLTRKHMNRNQIKRFNWIVFEKLTASLDPRRMQSVRVRPEPHA